MSTIEATLQDRMKEWVALTEDKRELEEALRKVQSKLTALEEPLLEDFTLAGMQSVNIDGMTLYRQREFTAKLKEGSDKEAALSAFQEAGLAGCFMLSWQTMRALVREHEENGEPLPEKVQEFLEIGEQFRLRTRKSAK